MSFMLPIGIVEEGRRQRAVQLRPLAGAHGRRLIDAVYGERGGDPVSTMLAVFVMRLGSRAEPDANRFDLLSFADRHALIAHLKIVQGEPCIEARVECPHCQSTQVFALDLRSIRLRGADPRRGITLRLNTQRRTLRLPTPADCAESADELDLIARCMDCRREDAEPWLARAQRAMSVYDPLGEIALTGACCACGTTLHGRANLADDWLTSTARRAATLMHEIHALASRYHWSEDDILALPGARREAYLDLCEPA